MAKPLKRRLRRNIRIDGQETAGERQARTAVRFIMDNRYYTSILKSLRAGTPLSKIAEHGVARGWFEVNQKTALSYLQYFRKMQPGLCKPQAISDKGDETNDLEYINKLVSGAELIVDEETELLRLIEVQKIRLGIGVMNERRLNMLMQSNRREVEELRNLIIDLAKLRGLITNNTNVHINGYSETVREDLKGIQQDEHQRNVIATLVSDLVRVSDG